MKTFRCDNCPCEKPGKKAKNNGTGPPAGWKRIGDRLLCKDCSKAGFVMRCVSVRVACPLGSAWDELRAALNHAWGEATRLTNWALRTLAVNDSVVGSGEKVQKPSKVYLYGLCNDQEQRRGFPSDATLAVMTRAEALYKRDRFDICRGARSVPSARFPQPLYKEIRKGTIGEVFREMEHDGQRGRLAVNVPIPCKDGTTKTFSLLLAAGWNNVRTTKAIRRMLAGEVMPRELAITQQGKHLMVRIVALFPRETRERSGTLYVRSTADLFCEAISVDKARLWCIHADLAKRWIAEHRRRIQNLGDDKKSEQRTRALRKQFAVEMDKRCGKHRDRMRSFMQMTAAEIAGWADRINADTVLWDGWGEKGEPGQHGFESFPWHEFRTTMKQKLDAKGVTLIFRACGDVTVEAA